MKRLIVPAILLFPLITLAVWFQVGARGPRVEPAASVAAANTSPVISTNTAPATNGIVTNFSK
jgi:hypothetical protein